MAKQVFVSPSKGAWRVQTVGTSRAAGVYSTQAEARVRGIEIARNQGAELCVQRKDGTIGEKNTYGPDPRKIRG